jgi:hypothetical protein
MKKFTPIQIRVNEPRAAAKQAANALRSPYLKGTFIPKDHVDARTCIKHSTTIEERIEFARNRIALLQAKLNPERVDSTRHREQPLPYSQPEPTRLNPAQAFRALAEHVHRNQQPRHKTTTKVVHLPSGIELRSVKTPLPDRPLATTPKELVTLYPEAREALLHILRSVK